ncbi:hypothetical protein ISF_03935 [Cordyceps fumosorosea ARSEF 2679]|uniref:Uncharacterized protein n=1 Tax=Cordyceps fumosorosea (strain ARSEF 2679) TaxID=1081104 RepID=A0A167YB47_CORFA|nr:hypothetical protein ISF_03935 [Cordyceps fumosorosea ARSEF 2679]OAA66097.1 hypothetical protein ISF_03935 [Cordyceps fumosorosea ARSEF 2679]
MAEMARLNELTAQIAQMHQQMDYWRGQERRTAAMLEAAMADMAGYTRRGRLPDPVVSAAVNNHSIALNRIRANMESLQRRRTAAEGEHRALAQRIRGRG